MEKTIIRIMCAVGFIAGAWITISGFLSWYKYGEPPGRSFDLGPFLIVFGATYFVVPDRFDERRLRWIVIGICVVITLLTEFLLRRP